MTPHSLALRIRGRRRTAEIRVLVTGAGSGSSSNLVRALRTMTHPPVIVGVNHDRFTLQQSAADANYLCPRYDSPDFIESALDIVDRQSLNVVMPSDDDAVKAFSDARDQFPLDLFLPARRSIELCQDKYALNRFLLRRAIPAPRAHKLRELKNVDKVMSRFSRGRIMWCRARRGSRSLAATPVASSLQARSWITQWRDLQGVKVSDFMLAEYLPGRHVVVYSVWLCGRLLLARSAEMLSYFAAGNNPSGVFSLPSLAKMVVIPEALRTSARALKAIEKRPTGVFIVEMKGSVTGKLCITEINAGRFPSGASALLSAGTYNMIEVFARAAIGRPISIADPLGDLSDRYLVRDIDSLPGVFTTAELLEGVRRTT